MKYIVALIVGMITSPAFGQNQSIETICRGDYCFRPIQQVPTITPGVEFVERFKGVEIVIKEEYQLKIKELEDRIKVLETKLNRKRKR